MANTLAPKCPVCRDFGVIVGSLPGLPTSAPLQHLPCPKGCTQRTATRTTMNTTTNPLLIACPICRAEVGKDCNGLPPGWQCGPRAVAAIAVAPKTKA